MNRRPIAGLALAAALLCAAPGPRAARKPPDRRSVRSALATPSTPPPAAQPVKPLSRRYSFALYQICYRAGAPASSAAYPLWSPDGSSRLNHLPLDAVGPWMDSARSAWHRDSFQSMARAGINIALIEYRPDWASQRDWGQRGVEMAAQALQEMRAEDLDGPSLGLFLDFSGPKTGWDLASPYVRRALFETIRGFYQRIPPSYRALVPTGKDENLPTAYPVFLGSPNGLSNWSPEFVTDLRERFRQAFGRPVALAGESQWKAGAPNMDAYFALDPSKPLGADSSGPIHTITLTPGYNERGVAPDPAPIRPRLNGRAYVTAWNDAGKQNADWTLLDSWNDWAAGTELAPSRETGDRDMNLTRAALANADSDAPYRARLLSESVPRAMLAGSRVRVEFRVQNAGIQPWPQSGALLRYRWNRNGQPVTSGDTSLTQTVRPRDEQTVGLLLPVLSGDAAGGGTPLPEGDYQLEFSLSIPAGTASGTAANAAGSSQSAVPGGEVSLGTYPVHVGALPPAAAVLLDSSLPRLIQAGPTYRARVRILNEGSRTWTRADHFLSYRWRRVRERPAGATDEDPPPLGAQAALKTPLKADVPPGALIDLDASVAALGDGGRPLDPSPPDGDWRYELEWVVSGSEGEASAGSEVIEAIAPDISAGFPLGIGVPQNMTADSPYELKVVVKNIGPERWSPGQASLGCRWYYWDGVPMMSDGKRVPVAGPLGPLEPGDQTLVRVPIQTPPIGGTFLLAVDVYADGHWASEAPAARGTVLTPEPVVIKGGGFQPLVLGGLFNADIIAPDSLPGDGDFDGEGHTFPGQIMPPLVASGDLRSTIYPSGYMGPVTGVGLDADRRVPFDYPLKQDGTPNAAACSGQTLKVRIAHPTALHLLMAADEDIPDADFILTYDDGSHEERHVSLTAWDKAPAGDGESNGFFSPVRNGPSGVERHPAYLKHYVLECNSRGTLVQLDLPNAPHIKLMAITAEAW